ncbi:ankyrin repeat domain-containing protein [Pedobacter gandavensis]|uniref:ankyrin repeat domain-containing protein n=1 Tax=Pedobacter gandavensis TaxID=2679963 RepID=UPI00292F90FE|nr:ankyrin repeat domain-containing protein [Pedobacter gandavensis]
MKYRATLLLCSLLFSLNTLTACSQEKTMTKTTEDIFQIIVRQDIPRLRLWLAGKPNLELKNKKGETPLMAATYLNQIPMTRLLIAAGANVNTQDNMLNSPFLYAGASGHLEIVKLCLSGGADYRVFNRYNGTALIPACEKGHVAVVEELLKDKTFPIDHINRLGWTALLEAVILGDGSAKQVKIIQLLIDAGANLAIKDKEGVSALDHAKQRNFKEIISLLEKAALKK